MFLGAMGEHYDRLTGRIIGGRLHKTSIKRQVNNPEKQAAKDHHLAHFFGCFWEEYHY